MTTPRKEITLAPELETELKAIYREMEAGYDRIADQVGLSCNGCPDNCCDSYFLHHTYAEWAFLWQGLTELDSQRLHLIRERAEQYVRRSRERVEAGEQPRIMCPLNENGLCSLYSHRLLVCRMHGIPAVMTRPDGQTLRFPGCFRCQEIVGNTYARSDDAPAMDRTPLFIRMARLESRLLGEQRHLFPRVRLTIADMIVQGPPSMSLPFCQR